MSKAPAAFSERVTAIALLAVAALVGFGATRIEYAFSSDPLGPQAFPLLLSASLAVLAVWYFVQPGHTDGWPSGGTLGKAVTLVAVTAVSIALMDKIGFVAAAAVMSGTAAAIFGAPLWLAGVIGVVQAAFWYGLFKYAFGTYLPAGTWLFPQ